MIQIRMKATGVVGNPRISGPDGIFYEIDPTTQIMVVPIYAVQSFLDEGFYPIDFVNLDGTPVAGSGSGVPDGGTTGQVLAKLSNDDGDAGWINPGAGGGSPGGLDKYIQFNDDGDFNGVQSYTFDKTLGIVTVDWTANNDTYQAGFTARGDDINNFVADAVDKGFGFTGSIWYWASNPNAPEPTHQLLRLVCGGDYNDAGVMANHVWYMVNYHVSGGYSYPLNIYLDTDNVVLGNAADDGVNTLQVGGSTKTTAIQTPLVSFPSAVANAFTLANAGLVFKDAGGNETLRIWATDPNESHNGSTNLFIGALAGGTPDLSTSDASYNNIGIGDRALTSLVSAEDNIAIGERALGALVGTAQDSYYNIVVGHGAASALVQGTENVVMGLAAFNSALDGDENSMFGSFACNVMQHGSKNAAFGASTNIHNNAVNAIALGYGVATTTNNTAVIGNADVLDVFFGSAAAASRINAKTGLFGTTTPRTGIRWGDYYSPVADPDVTVAPNQMVHTFTDVVGTSEVNRANYHVGWLFDVSVETTVDDPSDNLYGGIGVSTHVPSSNANDIGNLQAASLSAVHEGTGVINEHYGLTVGAVSFGRAQYLNGQYITASVNGASGDTDAAHGVDGVAAAQDNAHADQLVGVAGSAFTLFGGDADQAIGGDFSAGTYSGHIDDAIGVRVAVNAGGGGTITNALGLYIADVTAGGTSNKAIKTGLGAVEFGDTVLVGTGPFDTAPGGEYDFANVKSGVYARKTFSPNPASSAGHYGNLNTAVAGYVDIADVVDTDYNIYAGVTGIVKTPVTSKDIYEMYGGFFKTENHTTGAVYENYAVYAWAENDVDNPDLGVSGLFSAAETFADCGALFAAGLVTYCMATASVDHINPVYAQAYINPGVSITSQELILLNAFVNDHGTGHSIDEAYGLWLGDMTIGSKNWAIKTGLGKVEFGDYFTTKRNTAPADADLAAGELAFWFDKTNGAAKAMWKGKTADGTVVTGNAALT